jgi:KipI family sensor histidine kinase inhibitor
VIRIRPSGDTMLLVEFEQRIDPLVNDRVIQLSARLTQRLAGVVRDVVPAYCSIGVHFDPLLTDLAALERVIGEEAQGLVHAEPHDVKSIVEIPVRYGGDDGPDLEGVATWAGCTPDEVIARHAARTYRVYMLGFVAGFSFMGRVDKSIAAPRHRVPRERVPAGSVGIAGEQTGVYPISTPGGWQLIGRTSLKMFDVTRTPPNLVGPGDLVRFVPAKPVA